MKEELQEGDRVWWVEDTTTEIAEETCRNCAFSPYEIYTHPTLRTGIYEGFDSRHNRENVKLEDGKYAFCGVNDIYLDPRGAIEQFIEGLQEDLDEQLNEMLKQIGD